MRRPHLTTNYARDGFLVVEDALDPDLLAATRAEATAICRGDRGLFEGVTRADPDEADLSVLERHLCITFRTRSPR